jgi:hypothetical protein
LAAFVTACAGDSRHHETIDLTRVGGRWRTVMGRNRVADEALRRRSPGQPTGMIVKPSSPPPIADSKNPSRAITCRWHRRCHGDADPCRSVEIKKVVEREGVAMVVHASPADDI